MSNKKEQNSKNKSKLKKEKEKTNKTKRKYNIIKDPVLIDVNCKKCNKFLCGAMKDTKVWCPKCKIWMKVK